MANQDRYATDRVVYTRDGLTYLDIQGQWQLSADQLLDLQAQGVPVTIVEVCGDWAVNHDLGTRN